MPETCVSENGKNGQPPPPVKKVLCSALVYTALAGLHRTNSPATRPRSGAYTIYICLSYAPIGVYGAGDCYREMPRMSLLGISGHRGNGAAPYRRKSLFIEGNPHSVARYRPFAACVWEIAHKESSFRQPKSSFRRIPFLGHT